MAHTITSLEPVVEELEFDSQASFDDPSYLFLFHKTLALPMRVSFAGLSFSSGPTKDETSDKPQLQLHSRLSLSESPVIAAAE
jgi:hypothetical protein